MWLTNFIFSVYIYFKKPNDLNSNSRPYQIEFKKDKTITFSAKTIRFSEDFKKISPENRGCFFGNEKRLKIFKSYTEKNCLDECLINQTLRSCGCTQFSMPKNQTTPTCTFRKESDCYVAILLEFPSKDLGSSPCGCFKTCNDIEYYVKSEINFIPGKSGEIPKGLVT